MAVTLNGTSGLTLESNGSRITGDFSNNNVFSRTMFQTRIADDVTNVFAIPNGTGTAATFGVLNSNTANYSAGYMQMTSSAMYLVSDKGGTGSYKPLVFNTGGVERMRIDTSGNVTIANNISAAGTVSMGSAFANRNKIINGNFNFWQRGLGVSGTPYYVNSPTHYSADRWCGMGYQQGRHLYVSDVAGFRTTGLSSVNSMRVSSSTTSENAQGTRLSLAQKIAYAECYMLQGKSITLSFWIKFSAATFTSVSNSGDSAYGAFQYGIHFNTTGSQDAATWTDSSPDSSTVLTIANGSLPTVWTKYTLTTTCPGSLKNISVRYQTTNLGSTAVADSLYYQIAEVQLEEGTIATPFEVKGYNEQLAQCQRYYETFNVAIGPWWNNDAGNIQKGAYIPFKVTMRLTPSTIGFTNISATNTNNDYSAAISADGFSYATTILATGNYARVSTITASAEY